MAHCKMNILWFKENVSNDSLESWAEVNNFHIDEIVSNNDKCMLYASKKCDKGIWKLAEMVIYDKVNAFAYVIYDKNENHVIGTNSCHQFETYCFRQFDRLGEKLGAWN